jgi:predicted enzyme related to lactoylglutathione lyase
MGGGRGSGDKREGHGGDGLGDRVPTMSSKDPPRASWSERDRPPAQGSTLSLIEFPADDPERARRFWAELLGVELEAREDAAGEGWQTVSAGPAVGVHARGRGPGDSYSLPYFAVSDIARALARVQALGGSVVHPGEQWAICKDSEGSPFGLAGEPLSG